jgi:hypothetical protein
VKHWSMLMTEGGPYGNQHLEHMHGARFSASSDIVHAGWLFTPRPKVPKTMPEIFAAKWIDVLE